MFPPVGLPYVLPQLPDLGNPGPAFRKQVMAGLLVSSPAPLAEVVVRLPDLILRVRAYRRVSWHLPVIDFGVLRRNLRLSPFHRGGLYFRQGSPVRLEIHFAIARGRFAVATLAIWDRLVSHLSSSGTASSGWLPSAAALAILPAVSLPRTP